MLTNCVPSQGTLGFNGSIISQWGKSTIKQNVSSCWAGEHASGQREGRKKKTHVSLTHTYTVDEINFNLLKLF